MSQHSTPILYGSCFSSAAFRVRLMLAWKNIEYENRFIDLQNKDQVADLAKVNPSKRIPTFITSEGKVLTQSMAILEYLEEKYPERPCLPADPIQRAITRELCNEIGCDIHPIQNTGLAMQLYDTRAEVVAWARKHIIKGFDALEAKLRSIREENYVPAESKYCVGDAVTMADFFLVPQFYNAILYEVPLAPYPIIGSIHYHLKSIQEFIDASPERQSDYVQE
ncbi:maleylacetoacetate isomerase [Phascolomyces articulosus]|uniref:Maleylacetoacetate isomerase n=1 Tax=Phascolomyces articulosus TaxID=60185 RepID=A0AAD5K8T7_9FUNG|nr:maleylacetoacetate isomerase [Phascolomyces articulosus]